MGRALSKSMETLWDMLQTYIQHGFVLVISTSENFISRSHLMKRHIYHLKHPRVNQKKAKGRKCCSWTFKSMSVEVGTRGNVDHWNSLFLFVFNLFEGFINRILIDFVEVTVYYIALCSSSWIFYLFILYLIIIYFPLLEYNSVRAKLSNSLSPVSQVSWEPW